MMKVTPTEEMMMQGTDATSSFKQEFKEVDSVLRPEPAQTGRFF